MLTETLFCFQYDLTSASFGENLNTVKDAIGKQKADDTQVEDFQAFLERHKMSKVGLHVILKIIVWIYNTFENNFVIKHHHAIYLKENC